MTDLAEAIQRYVDEYIKEKIDAVDELTLTIGFGGQEPVLHFCPDRPPEHELEVMKPLRKALADELQSIEQDEPHKADLLHRLIETIDEWREEEDNDDRPAIP